MERIVSFDPIFERNARWLILGSMPSVESLKQGFYYAHPRNCFWPMMGELFGESARTVPEKRALLARNRLALWDTARSCLREGSLDSAILQPAPNDIAGLLAECPEIRAILFNGGASFQMFRKLLPDVGASLEKYQMPSTSPAYTLSYEKKRALWARALGVKGF